MISNQTTFKKNKLKMLQELTIQATYIELKRDKNGKTYFFILDRDTYQAYFAFPKRAKGWYDLAIK